MRAIPRLLIVCVVAGPLTLAAQTVAVAGGTQGSVTVATQTGVASGAAAAIAATPAITVAMPVLVPRTDPTNLRITNLSTRARVTSESPLVTGFAISGTTTRTVLVRAAGPALNAFGVAGAVVAPRLRLHDEAGAVISENAGWNTAAGADAAMATTGAFPFAAGSADAALVVTLSPGKYTAEVIAGGSGGGVALIEVYDVNGTAPGARLTNVSTLSTVTANGGEVISGFILAGTGTQSFLVRGIGPALTKFNVSNTLTDPNLTLFNSAGTPISTNNDWSGGGASTPAVVVPVPPGTGNVAVSAGASVAAAAAQAAVSAAQAAAAKVTAAPISAVAAATIQAAAQAGAFALDLGSADAALVVSLSPGAYTVQVNGVAATSGSGAASSAGSSLTSGVALLEIYELP